MPRRGPHAELQAGCGYHRTFGQTFVPEVVAWVERPHRCAGELVQRARARAVIRVPVGEEDRVDSRRARRDRREMGWVVRARINDDCAFGSGRAQHPGVGSGQRHRSGIGGEHHSSPGRHRPELLILQFAGHRVRRGNGTMVPSARTMHIPSASRRRTGATGVRSCASAAANTALTVG